MEGGGRLFRNACCTRYARVGRRGCGLIPVAWMPGLIILRHRRCRKGPAQGPSRLQHDVTAAPIRVLADFILTQPARPDFRVQIWAPWRTWARQSEVICNPTDTIPCDRHGDCYVQSTLALPRAWQWNSGYGHSTASGIGPGLQQEPLPYGARCSSALSRRGLGRYSDALCAITSSSSYPPLRPQRLDSQGRVGRHVSCHAHPKEVTSHHSPTISTKSRSDGTSGLGQSTLQPSTTSPNTKTGLSSSS